MGTDKEKTKTEDEMMQEKIIEKRASHLNALEKIQRIKDRRENSERVRAAVKYEGPTKLAEYSE